MWRLAFWALNIYGAKKTLDLMKENTELKQKTGDYQATIRTLAKLDPNAESTKKVLPVRPECLEHGVNDLSL